MRLLTWMALAAFLAPKVWAEPLVFPTVGLTPLNSTSTAVPATPVSPEETLVRAFYSAMNRGDKAALDALVAPDFSSDAALPGLKAGKAGLLAWISGLRHAFPDGQVELLDILVQEHRVAVRYRFMGRHQGRFLSLSPTHRRVAVSGMDLWTIEDGRLSAQSGDFDTLGLLVQLHIAPELK